MTTSKSASFPSRRKPTFILRLPYPPSINHYYGVTRSGKRFIGKEGQEYRRVVVEALREIPETNRTLTGRLQVWVEAFMPDRRKRDLDNIKKALLDALTHAEVYGDDSQIDDLRSVRREVVKGGYVIVHVAEL
jgi:crossover junction endodeoxyribonuclease RusA